MAYEVRTASVTGVASGNLTINYPAGIATGDILIACITIRSTVGFATPSGWTLIAENLDGDVDTTNGVASSQVFWTRYGGSGTSQSFTRTGGDLGYGSSIAVRGCLASGDVIDDSDITTVAGTALTAANVTASAGGSERFLCWFAALGDNGALSSQASTTPSGGSWSEHDFGGTNLGADGGGCISYHSVGLAASATTSALTGTSTTDGTHVLTTILLKPAVTPETPAPPTGSTTLTGAAVALALAVTVPTGALAITGQTPTPVQAGTPSYAVIGTGGTGSNVTSETFTYSAATTTGQTFVVCIGVHPNASRTVQSVTDNKGNSYTLAQQAGSAGSRHCCIYYCLAGTGGSDHQVTVTMDGANAYFSAQIIAINDVTAYDTGDTYSNSGTGTNYFADAGNIDTATQVAVVAVGAGNANLGSNISAGGAWTEQLEASYAYVQTRTPSATALTDERGDCTATTLYLAQAAIASFTGEEITAITAAVPSGSLALTGGAPSAKVAYRASPPSGSVAVTGQVPVASVAATISVPSGAVALTPQAPTAFSAFYPAPPSGSVTVTGQAPLGTLNLLATVPAGAVEVSGSAPSLGGASTISVPTGSVLVSGADPSLPGLYVELRQTSTLIARRQIPVTDSYQTFAFDLTEGEAAAITDWTALRVALIADGQQAFVSWVELQTPSASGAETPQPGTGSVAVTGYAPTAMVPSTITVPTGSVLVSGSAPSATLAIAVTTPAGTISLTGSAPVVALTVLPSSGTVTLTGAAPSARLAIVAQPGTGAIVLTGRVPQIIGEGALPVPSGAVTITGAAPTVQRTYLTQPGTGAVVLTGQAPSLGQSYAITVPTGAVTLTGAAPDLVGQGVLLVPRGPVTVTGHAPIVQHAHLAAPDTGVVTLTGQAPTVLAEARLTVPTGAVVLTGQAPTIAGAQAIVVPTGTVTLTGQAPTTGGTVTILTPTGSVTLTASAPTLARVIPVPSGALVLTGQPPLLGLDYVIVVPTGAVTLTGGLPEIAFGAVSPRTGAITLTSDAPTVTASSLPLVIVGASQQWTVEAHQAWAVEPSADWIVPAERTEWIA